MFTYESIHAVILLVNATEHVVRCHASGEIHLDLDSQLMVGDHPPEPWTTKNNQPKAQTAQ